MIIWKQQSGELTEIAPDTLPADILDAIKQALPDDEGDYAPYINETHRIIAVTDRALRDAELLEYKPNSDGSCALAGCGTSVLQHIVVPVQTPTGEICNAVESVAFFGNETLKSVTFLGSVSFQEMAFYECTVLEQITVCGVRTEIGDSAFNSCAALTRFDAWDALALVGKSAFWGCKSLERFSAHRIGALSEWAFCGCEALTDICGSLEVDEILSLAFQNCVSLREIKLPAGLVRIWFSAFENCVSLREIKLPDGLEGIYDSAFYGCTGLTEITVPYSVTYIGDMAFRHCTGLTYLRIPHAVAEDGLLEDEDIRRFTDFYSLYDPDGWESYNVDSYEGVEFVKKKHADRVLKDYQNNKKQEDTIMDDQQMQAKKIYEQFCSVLDKDGWKYERHDEDLIIASGLTSGTFAIKTFIFVDPDKYVLRVITQMPFRISEEQRVGAAIAVNVANYRKCIGSFGYDIADGEIHFRVVQSFRNSNLDDEILLEMFVISCAMGKQYCSKFYDISTGTMDLEEFIKWEREEH